MAKIVARGTITVDDDRPSCVTNHVPSPVEQPKIAFSGGKISVADGKVLTEDRCCTPSGDGQCCGGEWYASSEDGHCCNDVWYSAGNECEEGFVYLELGEDGECCGCFAEQIWDGRVQEFVSINSVIDELCCDCIGVHLPYDDETGELVGCSWRCCTEENGVGVGYMCTPMTEGKCAEVGGGWHPGTCCGSGCPAPCCSESPQGEFSCEVKDSGLCAPDGIVDKSTDTCDEACKGWCCVWSEGGIPTTYENKTPAECEALGGCFTGILAAMEGAPGLPACPEGCRKPYTRQCCERKESTAAGLTFTFQRKKRCPELDPSAGVVARVTGCTKSPVYIHGTFVNTGEFDVTVRTCNDRFYIDPYPCGSRFKGIDVTVCWDWYTLFRPIASCLALGGGAELLDFKPACNNNRTIMLGNCEVRFDLCGADVVQCITRILYDSDDEDLSGVGEESSVTIEMHGSAIIEANGIGPLVLTGDITAYGTCELPYKHTLRLSGNSTDDNEISGKITGSAARGYDLEILKLGVGRWILSNKNNRLGHESVYVLGGTLVVKGDMSVTETPVGDEVANPIILGAKSFAEYVGSGSVDEAILLIEDLFTRTIAIPEEPFTAARLQGAIIGTIQGGLNLVFDGQLNAERTVTFQVSDGMTLQWNPAYIRDETGTTGATVPVVIGTPGNDGVFILKYHWKPLNDASLESVSIMHGTLRVPQSAFTESDVPKVSKAEFTNSTLTVTFSESPEHGEEFMLLTIPTVQEYEHTNITLIGAGSVHAIYDSETSTLIIDGISPTITITSDKMKLESGETAEITFTLSDESTDFTINDVSVVGGTLSDFEGEGTSYTATFTPDPMPATNGIISVPADAFTDEAGNGNMASNTLTIDTIRPTLTITSSKPVLKIDETATITFTLSEASESFGVDDVTVGGGSLSGFSGSGTSYTATFTPSASSVADGTISVAEDAFTDIAGLGNVAAELSPPIAIDTIAPTITITSDKNVVQAGETATITFTISEAPNSFKRADVSVTGGTLSALSGSGTSYTATFTASSPAPASATIEVVDSAFTDNAGNGNAAESLTITLEN